MKPSEYARRAPFPYFGGKAKIADLVWPRFGRVALYREPFFGSGAVLLSAPTASAHEVVGDLNVYVANFWRATCYQPEAVAAYATYPASHIDLTARHRWLCEPERVAALANAMQDAQWPGDAQIAGWWAWGACNWIGSGWCAPRASLRDQVPMYSQRGQGLGAPGRNPQDWLAALARRLQHVVIIHGDWQRAIHHHFGRDGRSTVGLFFDPPYRGFESLYPGSAPVADAVAAWCREHGNDERRRIALCGYDGDYNLPGWEIVRWDRRAGGRGATFGSVERAQDEAIWFSPGCLKVEKQPRQLEIGVGHDR